MLFEIFDYLINLTEPILLFLLLRSKLVFEKDRLPLAIVGIFIISGLTTLANKLSLSFAVTMLLALAECELFSLICFRGDIKKRLFWGGLFVIILCITNGVLFLSFAVFVVSELLLSATLQRIIMCIVYVALAAVITFAFIRYDEKRRVFPKYIDLIVIALCIVGGVGLYMTLDEISYLTSHNLPAANSIISAVIFMVFIVSLLLLLDVISKITKKQVDAEAELLAIKNREEYEQRILAMTDTFRKIKHDYANHMSAVSAYVKGDDLESLRRYMDEYNSKYSVDTVFITGNAALDTVLTQKAMICEHDGIQFNFSAELGMPIPLTDVEITSILGNLLDNAIEAQRDVTAEKYINLKIMTVEHMFIIQSENSSTGSYVYENQKLTTSKQDKRTHGYGLKIISDAVDSHNGVFVVNPEAERFITEIYIQI